MELSKDKLITNFIHYQKEYNQQRKLSNYEEKLKKIKTNFSSEHSEINLQRTAKVNYKNFCAHGTKGWTLFSAFAFTGGQLLPGNEIKLNGLFVNSGEIKGRDQKGGSFVSTITANGFSTYLHSAQNYSLMEALDYVDFKKLSLNKYNKINESLIVENLEKILKNYEMREIYEKLSHISVIVMGDGIGKYDNFYKDIKSKELLDSLIKEEIISDDVIFKEIETDEKIEIPLAGICNEEDEILYKRVNVRVVIVDKENQNFIKKFIQFINPKLAKIIIFLSIEEVIGFERGREFNEGKYVRTFVIDFANYFKDKLTFQFASNVTKKVKIMEKFCYKNRSVDNPSCNKKVRDFVRSISYHTENSDNINYSKREKKTLQYYKNEDFDDFLSSYSKCLNNRFFIREYNDTSLENFNKLSKFYKYCSYSAKETPDFTLWNPDEFLLKIDYSKILMEGYNSQCTNKIEKNELKEIITEECFSNNTKMQS